MVGLTHVILHLSFCAAIAHLSPDSTFAVHVHLTDKGGREQVNQTFNVPRGYGSESVVEFDTTQGSRRIDIVAPKFGCSATDFVWFIPDLTRTVSEKLESAPPSQRFVTLVSGTAPQSMFYANPTFVVFDKAAATCGKPIPTAIPTELDVDNERDSYYASIYDDGSHPPGSEQLVLRLQTPTHQHHYVRIPIAYPFPQANWPPGIQLDIPDELMADIATQPIDTLLCPKFLHTSAG